MSGKAQDRYLFRFNNGNLVTVKAEVADVNVRKGRGMVMLAGDPPAVEEPEKDSKENKGGNDNG